MKAKKKYGQNFLKNEEIIKNITDLVNPNENDLIIEIGPGRGALTKYLIKKNCDLVCIEIDTDLKFYLDKYQSKKCKIIYEDILKVDFKEITKNYQNIYVVGNLPYYITSPIIEHLINNIKSKKMVFMVQKEDVTSSMRRIAKTVNFGIVYGQTEFGLSSQLNISRKEASEFMKTYFASFPSIHSFMNEVISFCQENGYVKTLFNRRREIPEINDKNFMTREFGKRAAMNAPIQGSAADLIKIAMIKVVERMKKEKVKSKLLLQIHDELIFEVPKEEMETMISLVKEEMENVLELKVPLQASISCGKTWYEAK